MILKLAVEQARSQKRYTIWTAALLTFALTLISFSLFVVATQRETDRMAQQLGLPPGEFGAQVYSPLEEVSPDAGLTSGLGEFVSTDDIDARLAAALALCPGVTASRSTSLTIGDLPDGEYSFEYLDEHSTGGLGVQAISGTYDWDLALGAGTPPGPGEIAVSAAFAERHGLGIGDTLTVLSVSWDERSDQPVVTVERTVLTISGLARSGYSFYGGYSAWAPEAYVSWEDSSDPDGPFPINWWIREGGGTLRVIETLLSWDGDRPTLASLSGSEFFAPSISWSTQHPATATVAAGFAALALLGTVTMAFSVGRSQAQVRLQWLATARTLGVTRRTLAAVAVVETLLIAAVAAVAGFLLGLGAATLHLAFARGLVPMPLLPDAVAIPAWVPVITASAGLLMAGVVAAIPAFWASRIPPVAALKPVTDVSQAEVSRRVSIVVLLPLFVLGLVAFAVDLGDGPLGVVVRVLGAVVGCVTGYVLLLESTRGVVPALGRWLGRRRAAWALAAGDALVARPRQAVAPAFLLALGFTIYTASVIDANLWSFEFGWRDSFGERGGQEFTPAGIAVLGGGAMATIVAVLAILQLVALGAALAGERSLSSDTATHRALGLSTRDARWARSVVHGVPQVAGMVVGLVAGYLLAMYLYFAPIDILVDSRPPTSGDFFFALDEANHSIGFTIGAAIVVILVGSALLALGAHRETPVEALSRTG